jgi:SAM-dependent methyltransferase
MSLVKRDSWFRDYQEIPGVRDGKRKLDDRTVGFIADDFCGKTVLDLGCNIGQISLYAAECGATSVLGIEYDRDAFNEATKIRDDKGHSNVRYKLDDLDNPLFWGHIESHDTVLLLSVIDTKELENRFGILSRACMKCRSTFYFEGHWGQSPAKYFRYILDNTDFTQVEYVGRYKHRDLFRCSRNVLDTDGFYETLLRMCKQYKRIAIVGNQMAGKSTLCRGVNMPEFAVFDDYNDLDVIRSSKRLILSDYRAMQYANNFDVVFSVVQPQEKFETTRNNSRHLRSSVMDTSDTLRCLYTVRTH